MYTLYTMYARPALVRGALDRAGGMAHWRRDAERGGDRAANPRKEKVTDCSRRRMPTDHADGAWPWP